MLPPGDKFFGRIRSADIECPRCTNVYLIGVAGRNKRGYYDAKRSRFRCPHCGMVLVLGIIAWLPPAGPPTTPHDHIPSVRQALQLRQTIGALWVEKRLKTGEPANRLVEEETHE